LTLALSRLVFVKLLAIHFLRSREVVVIAASVSKLMLFLELVLLVEHTCQVTDVVGADFEHFNHIFDKFEIIFTDAVHASIRKLLLLLFDRNLLANDVNVVHRVNDLAHLLRVLILLVNLVLEILLKRRVILRDSFQFRLKFLHLFLAFVQGVSQF